jgi:hypothetical protein
MQSSTWHGANSRAFSPIARDDSLETLCPYLCPSWERSTVEDRRERGTTNLRQAV